MGNDKIVTDQQFCVPETQGNGWATAEWSGQAISGGSVWTEARMRRTSHVGMGVKNFLGWGDSVYKGPEVGPSLLCLRTIQETSTWNSNIYISHLICKIAMRKKLLFSVLRTSKRRHWDMNIGILTPSSIEPSRLPPWRFQLGDRQTSASNKWPEEQFSWEQSLFLPSALCL